MPTLHCEGYSDRQCGPVPARLCRDPVFLRAALLNCLIQVVAEPGWRSTDLRAREMLRRDLTGIEPLRRWRSDRFIAPTHAAVRVPAHIVAAHSRDACERSQLTTNQRNAAMI
jgi:hypothetical protein